MEMTLGRISVAFRILPAPGRRMARRDGPVGETGLMRLIRQRLDSLHVAELGPHLRRDVGLDPAWRADDIALRHPELVLWAGLHR